MFSEYSINPFPWFRPKVDERDTEMEEGRASEHKCKPGSFNAVELEGAARVLNFDPDLWVFRRFGKLHLLNILHLQQHLANLEDQLEKQKSNTNKTPKTLGKLMLKINRALAEYDAALSAQAAFKAYKVPEQRIIKQIDECAATGRENCQPLRVGLNIRLGSANRKELASIAAANKTWTRRFIDRHNCLRKWFKDEDIPALPIYLYSEESVRFAEQLFLHASFCVLVVGPIVALSYLKSKAWKLGLLTLCVLVASAFSGGFLNTPNRNGLALVAGYTAILVVFLSNNVGI